ncbi:hypothetical protein AB7M66_009928 [Bradyrhizobium japonicum]
MPAVQKPHWSAWLRRNACCSTPSRSRRRREAFDGPELATIDLRSEREARPRQHAVDDNSAGATDAVLAADMGAGRAQLVAQKIGEQHARLRLALDRLAVERETDGMALICLKTGHCSTSPIRSRPIMRTRSRR